MPRTAVSNSTSLPLKEGSDMPILIETLIALLIAFGLGLLLAWFIWGKSDERTN